MPDMDIKSVLNILYGIEILPHGRGASPILKYEIGQTGISREIHSEHLLDLPLIGDRGSENINNRVDGWFLP